MFKASRTGIRIAAKCAPDRRYLELSANAGIQAVELYTSSQILSMLDRAITACRDFSFSYAVHAPTEGYQPEALAAFVQAVKAKVVVFHNIYWEDEWEHIHQVFRDLPVRLCIENMSDIHEAERYIRRFGMSRCLDFEHYEMQHGGMPESGLAALIRQTAHVHMTGYTTGSNRWHTHIHYAEERNMRLLEILAKNNYQGFVVSEANLSQQSLEEFQTLAKFAEKWDKQYLKEFKA